MRLRDGWFVSDLFKRQSGVACPRCHGPMREIITITPTGTEPGLIGYECAACGYVTSVIVPAKAKSRDD